MKKLMQCLRFFVQQLWDAWRLRGLWVLLDGRDNSVSFSPRLWRRIKGTLVSHDRANVIVARVAGGYGFEVNAPLECETQIAEIQYNTKYGSVGFESLIPTVNRMLYDMGLPAAVGVKLSVEPLELGGRTVYIIRSDRFC